MTLLAHQCVPSALLGYVFETGVESDTHLDAVGQSGDHWCLISNHNETCRDARVIGRIQERYGVRYRHRTSRGATEEGVVWKEPVTLPMLPGVNWRKRPEPETVRLRHDLIVTHLSTLNVAVEVTFQGRRGRGAKWEDAGRTVLNLSLGNHDGSHSLA